MASLIGVDTYFHVGDEGFILPPEDRERIQERKMELETKIKDIAKMVSSKELSNTCRASKKNMPDTCRDLSIKGKDLMERLRRLLLSHKRRPRDHLRPLTRRSP